MVCLKIEEHVFNGLQSTSDPQISVLLSSRALSFTGQPAFNTREKQMEKILLSINFASFG